MIGAFYFAAEIIPVALVSGVSLGSAKAVVTGFVQTFLVASQAAGIVDIIGSFAKGEVSKALFMTALEAAPFAFNGVKKLYKATVLKNLKNAAATHSLAVIDDINLAGISDFLEVQGLDEIARLKNFRFLGNEGTLKIDLQFFAATDGMVNIDYAYFSKLDDAFVKYADEFADISKEKYFNDALELATKAESSSIITSNIDDVTKVTYNKATGEYVVIKNSDEVSAFTKIDVDLNEQDIIDVFEEVIEGTSNLVDVVADIGKAANVDDAVQIVKSSNISKWADADKYELMADTFKKADWSEADIAKLQRSIAEESGWIGKYYDENMDIIWPGTKEDPNIDGFLNGVSNPEMLQVGSTIDRYGHPGGAYLSPEGTPYGARVLNPGKKLVIILYMKFSSQLKLVLVKLHHGLDNQVWESSII